MKIPKKPGTFTLCAYITPQGVPFIEELYKHNSSGKYTARRWFYINGEIYLFWYKSDEYNPFVLKQMEDSKKLPPETLGMSVVGQLLEQIKRKTINLEMTDHAEFSMENTNVG